MRRGAAIKVLVSLAALAAVVAVCDPGRILPAIGRADPRWLLAAGALWVAIQLVNVWKWWLLGRAQGLAVGYRALLGVYFIGMFFNVFLPSGFGGDVLRAYELAKLTPQGGGGSAASVVVDRFTSLYALCLVAAAALLAAPGEFRALRYVAIGAVVAGGALGAAVLFNAGRLKAATTWPAIAARRRLARFAAELADAIGALRGAQAAIAAALCISIAFQALAVVLHYCLIRALGLDVSFAYTAFFFPVLSLAASLPLTINGLAIREGGFAFFLGRVGVPPAEAVAVGLLSLAMLLLSGLWGAIVYASDRRSPAAPAVSSPPGA